jgi:hypothetical protein
VERRSAHQSSTEKSRLATQSNDDARFAEPALSATATGRLQRGSLLTYLSDVIAARPMPPICRSFAPAYARSLGRLLHV